MSDLNRRNAAALAKLEAAHNEPPEDILDTPAFEDKMIEIWNERHMDINGYFIEGITERSDDDLKMLARLILGNTNGTHTTTIGAFVSKWITDYCKPSDSDVIEALNDQFEDY